MCTIWAMVSDSSIIIVDTVFCIDVAGSIQAFRVGLLSPASNFELLPMDQKKSWNTWRFKEKYLVLHKTRLVNRVLTSQPGRRSTQLCQVYSVSSY